MFKAIRKALAPFRKALVAPAVAVVLAVLGVVGIIPTPEIVEVVSLLILGGLTYLIPNES